MNPYKVLIEEIIRKQATVLGLGVAIKRARNIEGLKVEDDSTVTELPADGIGTIEKLVEQYKILSGNIGVQFCKQAADAWIALYPHEKLPPILL